MQTAKPHDYQKIADQHGIDLRDIRPLSRDERRQVLLRVLEDDSVPYPIPVPKRASYLTAFDQAQPFRLGEFSDLTVELGEYANEQRYEEYTFEEHLSWACLVAQQQITKHQYGCREYLRGEALFEIGGAVIPDSYILNARIFQQTGWQLATVNEIIPAELFFTCHSRRFFPVTTFMRPLGTDYLQEPDIGHDVAGHVATFTIPAVAQVMKDHGEARNLIYAELDEKLRSTTDPQEQLRFQQEADELLAFAGRIYWFTVEFGLVMQEGDLKAFGAGILSSPGETAFSVQSDEPNRILVDPSVDADLMRLANTDYLISEFQKTYFISKGFDLLGSLTPERILAASKQAMALPDFTWREVVPGDHVINVGTIVTSPNEKYYRAMAGLPQDECLQRTAMKNLSMYAAGMDPELLALFKVPPPPVPEAALDWYRSEEA